MTIDGWSNIQNVPIVGVSKAGILDEKISVVDSVRKLMKIATLHNI